MDGLRVTEISDSRISESGDYRVTEGYVAQTGDTSLTGTGTLSPEGLRRVPAAVDLNALTSHTHIGIGIFWGNFDVYATHTLAAIGQTKAAGAVNFTATGSISSTGKVIFKGENNFSGVGSIASIGVRICPGLTNLSATGTQQALGGLKSIGLADFSGTGFNTYSEKFIASGKFESIQDSYERITEAGDNRITETGDDRITETEFTNIVFGSIIVQPTYTPFNSELYVKYLNNWKIGNPSVKYQNEWVTPIRTYRYMNNRWKRIN